MARSIYQNVTHYKKIQDEYRGINEKEWILSPDKTIYLYKKTKIKDDNTSTNAHYGELFFYDICTLLSFPCAKTKLAIRNNEKGIISEYFLEHDEELVDFQLLIQAIRSDFNPKSLKCKKSKEYYSLDLLLQATQFAVKNKELYQKIKTDMIDTCLVDYLCGHYDRNPSNIGLIKNYSKENAEKYRLTPAFDNGTSHAMSLPIEIAQNYLVSENGLDQLHAVIYSKIGLGTTRTCPYSQLLEYIFMKYPYEGKELLEKIGDMITTENVENILNQYCYQDLDDIHKELAYRKLLYTKEKLLAYQNNAANQKIKRL